MKGKGLIARKSITINVPAKMVWEALTTPSMIKEYLFGTDAFSDWKAGSPISYKGTWQGQAYEDKGKIIKVIPEKTLVSTYWSSMGGLEDKPENYATVTYELDDRDGKTEVTIVQDNNPTEESKKHSEQNWGMVLGSMKKLLEREKSP